MSMHDEWYAMDAEGNLVPVPSPERKPVSTQESAKFTVEITLSSDHGELPNNVEVTEYLFDGLNRLVSDGTMVDAYPIAIEIKSRTGEI